MTAAFTDPAFRKFSMSRNGDTAPSYDSMVVELTGSAGPDVAKHLFNPIEIGLGHCINWNHEFRGKAALQEYAKGGGRRNLVTLEWSPEDLTEIYASQFRPGEEPYRPMDFPGQETAIIGHFVQGVDLVFSKDGKEIGLSIGRTQSHYHQVMLSMGSLDRDYRGLGTEVYVLWGEPGTRQMKIRAKVSAFPYNQHLANKVFDVETVPHPIKT